MGLPVCSYTGSGVCPNTEHCCAINKLYNDIVKSLHEAEHLSVPRIPLNSLKPFWSAELDEFKDKAILWHNIWVANGRPSGGSIQRIKSSSKLRYKKAIKDAFIEFESSNNNEID